MNSASIEPSFFVSNFQDMNEPSNNGYGSVYGCPDDNWDKPPYTPGEHYVFDYIKPKYNARVFIIALVTLL